MSYEMKRADVIAFAHFMGAETKERGEEVMFKHCPQCSGGAHHDDYTFSVNGKTGAFCCQRASCGYKGHFVELCRDYNFPLEYEAPKVFKRLPQPKKKIEPTAEAIKYLESRGISKETADKYEVTSSKKDDAVLLFPFFDERGELIFIKYRDTKFGKRSGQKHGNKEWCERDTQPILFGMKQCRGFERLIVTEGQLDSLSVAEAGFDNAVSVPTGANGFTWWMPCKEWLERFQEIIIFGDYEHGKITLLDTFHARLPGKVKAVRKVDYLGEKDANDILRKYGPQAIRKAVNNAEPPKIENVKELSDVQAVDMNNIEVVKTGIWSLDKVIKGLGMGEVTLLTGKRGEGKSTFASQIICSALNQGETVFAYSGELCDFNFKRWLDFQLAGCPNIEEHETEYGTLEYSIPDDVEEKINAWYRGKMFIYDNSYMPPNNEEKESLLETVEKVINQYGARLIVLDNLMTAMDDVRSQNDLWLAQSNFVGNLKRLAQRYNVTILLVAHPKKTQGMLGNDDVSGSSDITNKVDKVISYAKAEPMISGEDRKDYDNTINVLKNRFNGRLLLGKENAIKLSFSQKSKRVNDIEHVNLEQYGWEEVDLKMPEFIELNDSDDLPF